LPHGYIETNLLRTGSTSVIHTITKSSADYNLAVYLNGILIADLPVGTINKTIEWDFIDGINKLVVTYDKNIIGQISFNLIEGLNISRYGSIFIDYYGYLDPFEFQNKVTNDNYYFTIDTIFGRKEILASQQLVGKSKFNFITKNSGLVESIRFRVDLNRYEDPFVSPVIESIKIKFKHNDI
jgi:hypothetical protein